ncbi:MAG: transporter substrate-binding domain-containing protein [Anaeromyxobacteraceae bacterium]
MGTSLRRIATLGVALGVVAQARPALARSGDLAEVEAAGVLRHLGVPYANFVTGGGDGFDVELMKLFAARLGVRYEFVQSDWPAVIPDLVGRRVSAAAPDPERAAPVPVRGDVVAMGMTVLPWRQRALAFSAPVFPTQVWVIARADSPVRPIKPSASIEGDIAAVKALLANRTLLGVPSTCLDPSLYALEKTGAKLAIRKVQLDEVAALLIGGDGELALLDVADAMIALQKWPGQIKVVGPVSPRQHMAVAFRGDSPRLRAAFDTFFAEAKRDGTYDRLVRKYFPAVPLYFPEFFEKARGQG